MAVYKGQVVDEKDIAISETAAKYELKIKDNTPLEFEWHQQKKMQDTEASYGELAKLKKLEGLFIRHFTVVLSEKDNESNYIEISTAKVPFDADNLQATVDLLRDTAFVNKDVVVEFEYKTILFVSGAQFKQWIEMNKYDITEIQKEGKIKQ